MRRLKKAKWVDPGMWRLIDKLSTVTPFNQTNKPNNECKNLAEHIEKNEAEWYAYIYQDRIMEEEEKQRKIDAENETPKR